MSELIAKWKEWTPPLQGRFIHAEDDDAIQALPPGKVAPARTWSEYVASSDFGKSESQLELQLLPIPFLGDVANAKVLLLLQNPGLSPSDYHAELKQKGYRELLLENLRGDRRNHDFPFLFLDPELAWHAGFTWWHRKLQPVIEEVVKQGDVLGRKLTLRDARQAVARYVAAIELLPYHSRTGVLTQAQLNQFKSVSWARQHVAEVLNAGKTDVIAMRQVKLWDQTGEFARFPTWHAYPGNQSMAATLKPRHSNGGGDRIVKAVIAALKTSGEP